MQDLLACSASLGPASPRSEIQRTLHRDLDAATTRIRRVMHMRICSSRARHPQNGRNGSRHSYIPVLVYTTSVLGCGRYKFAHLGKQCSYAPAYSNMLLGHRPTPAFLWPSDCYWPLTLYISSAAASQWLSAGCCWSPRKWHRSCCRGRISLPGLLSQNPFPPSTQRPGLRPCPRPATHTA